MGVLRFHHKQICKQSGRESRAGGRHSRHQVCLSQHPRTVGHGDSSFTFKLQARKDKEMEQLDKIIRAVANQKSDFGGEQALCPMHKTVSLLSILNSLDVLPLPALVGLFDIKPVFTMSCMESFHKKSPMDQNWQTWGAPPSTHRQRLSKSSMSCQECLGSFSSMKITCFECARGSTTTLTKESGMCSLKGCPCSGLLPTKRREQCAS